jgi:hypothetical protein
MGLQPHESWPIERRALAPGLLLVMRSHRAVAPLNGTIRDVTSSLWKLP